MKRILFLLSALLILLCSAAWLNIFAKHTFATEITFVELGFGWMWVTAVSRILICLSFVFVLFTVIKRGNKGTFISSLAGLLILIGLSEVLMASPLGKGYSDEYFTPLFYKTFGRITFYLIFISLIFVSRITFPDEWLAKVSADFYIKLGIFVVVFFGFFLIKPIYYVDYTSWEKDKVKAPVKQLKRITEFDQSKPTYLFYFSTGCGHCYMLFHSIRVSASSIPQSAQIKMIFEGTEEQLADFTCKYKIPYKYELIKDKSFFHECGPELPSIFELQNHADNHYWVGDQFNYLKLSELCE